MSIYLGKKLKILSIILGKKYGLCNLQSCKVGLNGWLLVWCRCLLKICSFSNDKIIRMLGNFATLQVAKFFIFFPFFSWSWAALRHSSSELDFASEGCGDGCFLRSSLLAPCWRVVKKQKKNENIFFVWQKLSKWGCNFAPEKILQKHAIKHKNKFHRHRKFYYICGYKKVRPESPALNVFTTD